MAGIEHDESLAVFSSSWDFEGPGYDEMGRLLDGPNPAGRRGLLHRHDRQGGLPRGRCERGRVPGREIGITGYDDSMVCVSMDVPLTPR